MVGVETPTYISPSSLVEQMQELEQRLLEAEQRAENAETQVTGAGDWWDCAAEMAVGLS